MFLRGAGVTLYISIIGTIIGLIIGLLVGVIRTIPIRDGGYKRIILKVINVILSPIDPERRKNPAPPGASLTFQPDKLS